MITTTLSISDSQANQTADIASLAMFYNPSQYEETSSFTLLGFEIKSDFSKRA